VPSQQPDLRAKGSYPLCSEMKNLDYLTDAPYACSADDADVMAFTKAASIIGGRDAVDEFVAYDIWPLSDNWDFAVETKESLRFRKLPCRCCR
jgi:hypothetical protein